LLCPANFGISIDPVDQSKHGFHLFFWIALTVLKRPSTRLMDSISCLGCIP